MAIWGTKVHFVSIQIAHEMHLFLSRTGKQMHSNGHFEHQNAFREHSDCTRNAFVSESDWQANAFKWSFGSTKVHFVSIQTAPKMHLFLSRTGKQMHSNGQREHQSAFREHQSAFLSRTGKQMHSNGHCTRNAFVSESDWQANAFKWSFGSTKVHFVSIQTVPKMQLFLSRTDKQMHSNGHLEHQSAFREHSNCTRNAFVSQSDWQANAFKWSFESTKVRLVSIQTVPEMHLFLSQTGKQMHSNGHFEHQSAFREHSDCTRNAVCF